MSFTDWFSEVSSPNGLIYSLDERKEISCCQLCACYLLFDLKRLPRRLRIINDQIVEDKCLVLLVIDVIKPQGTYFNNWLQLSCRSSKFSSSFSATSVLLYASLDPIREPAKCFKFFSDKHLFIYYFWPHTMNYKQNNNDNK